MTLRGIHFVAVLALLAGGIPAMAQSAALATSLRAAPDPAAEAAARGAAARAVSVLFSRIAASDAAPNVTVGQLLDRTRSVDAFGRVLEDAEQIGGPRWIDDTTCQVQLQISRRRVEDALQRYAQMEGGISLAALSKSARDWPEYFSATGTSIAASGADRIATLSGGAAWDRVPESARKAALLRARDEAIRGARASVLSVRIAPDETLGDAMREPAVSDLIDRFFSEQPLSRVLFQDDLTVEVRLGTPTEDFFNAVRSALLRQKIGNLPAPDDSAAWGRIAADFSRQFVPPVGRAKAEAGGGASQAVRMPAAAPEWSMGEMEAEGSADVGRSRLGGAEQAGNEALRELRRRIDALPLVEQMTLGEAARKDPAIAVAIDRAMSRARVVRTDYGDRTVRRRLTIDLGDLWDELRR